jgi:hypothetical protein
VLTHLLRPKVVLISVPRIPGCLCFVNRHESSDSRSLFGSILTNDVILFSGKVLFVGPIWVVKLTGVQFQQRNRYAGDRLVYVPAHTQILQFGNDMPLFPKAKLFFANGMTSRD